MITERDLVIVGGGPAGMAAAISAYENGITDILLIERDQYLGGILNQCIHTGFGINYFDEILTGPEYADRFIKKLIMIKEIEVSLKTFVVDLDEDKVLTLFKPGSISQVKAKTLIMATGCRERTREMIHIAGDRPSGIFSAGLAQKMINIEGLLPGKDIVIIGSGDIGLIMARRFTLEGAKVRAIIEILPEVKGLLRNKIQCVDDFDIPMYFSHKVKRICGKKRVEKVEIGKIDKNFSIIPGTETEIECDTVLVSVGLIPENDIIEKIDYKNIPGIYICGNAYKVYDLVDSVSRDSELTGKEAANRH